jgi:hypothetical protein
MKNNIDIFHNFFRSNQHLLEKGDNNWPIERVLYQLSHEHAEDSPITKQVEKFLKNGRVSWQHFQQTNRNKTLERNPNIKTYIGHDDVVEGVHLIGDNQALSWSTDRNMRLWNLQEGSSKIFYNAVNIKGVHLIVDSALSWSGDGTLRLWDLQDGSSKLFKGHTKGVSGVHLTGDSQALSWSGDGTLRLWDLQDGSSKLFKGHTKGVSGVHLIGDSQALSWSADGTLRLWDLQDGSSKIFNVDKGYPRGVCLIDDNCVFTWSS